MLKSLSRTQSQSFQRLLHQNTTFRIRNEEIRSDEELARFRPGQWFNDQIINAYGLYLAVRFPDCIIVHTMTTSLLTTNMDGIPSRNFMRNHPLDGKRYVFFPTNLNHTLGAGCLPRPGKDRRHLRFHGWGRHLQPTCASDGEGRGNMVGASRSFP